MGYMVIHLRVNLRQMSRTAESHTSTSFQRPRGPNSGVYSKRSLDFGPRRHRPEYKLFLPFSCWDSHFGLGCITKSVESNYISWIPIYSTTPVRTELFFGKPNGWLDLSCQTPDWTLLRICKVYYLSSTSLGKARICSNDAYQSAAVARKWVSNEWQHGVNHGLRGLCR